MFNTLDNLPARIDCLNDLRQLADFFDYRTSEYTGDFDLDNLFTYISKSGDLRNLIWKADKNWLMYLEIAKNALRPRFPKPSRPIPPAGKNAIEENVELDEIPPLGPTIHGPMVRFYTLCNMSANLDKNFMSFYVQGKKKKSEERENW